MKSDINLRVKSLRAKKNIDQIDMAKVMGVAQGTYSMIESGKTGVTTDHILRLIENFNINPQWLLIGTGSMFLEESKSGGPENVGVDVGVNVGKYEEVKTKATYLTDEVPTYQAVPSAITVSPDNEPEIVLVEAKARAGYHSILEEPERYLKERPVIRLPGRKYKNGTFRAFEVYSDSMEPNFHDKDIALTEFVENWPFSLVSGQPYVVCTKDDVVLKRIFSRPDKDNLLHLHCDNLVYSDYTVPIEEVLELWMVLDKITSHLTIESEPISVRLDGLERNLRQVMVKVGLKPR